MSEDGTPSAAHSNAPSKQLSRHPAKRHSEGCHPLGWPAIPMNDVTSDRSRPAPRPPVKRVSRRRYMVRRVGVLVVLALLVVGGVKLVGAVVGTDGDADATSTSGVDGTGLAGTELGAGATGDTGTAASGAVTIDPTATTLDPGATVDPALTTTTAAATTTSDASVTPTAADPARVLIAGDSDAGTFGPYLQSLLGETGIVTTSLDYKVSSGLARPDFYDWPAHFRDSIPTSLPDIVIVTFGGNDSQGLTDLSGTFIVDQATGEAGGDAEWREEYGRRVGEVMDFLSADGRKLIWVGIPNDDNPDVTARLAVQNEVVMEQAAARPQVAFVDTWKRFSGRSGNWAEYVVDPRDGQAKDVRADDGFHLNTVGAEILALDIVAVVKAELVARGATL